MSFSIKLDQFTSNGKGPKGTVHMSQGKSSDNARETRKEILDLLKQIDQKLDQIIAKQ